MIRKCNFCLNDYEAEQRYLNRNQGLFCSISCGIKYTHSQKQKPQPNTICSYCQKDLYVKHSRLIKTDFHFCDKECQHKGFSDPSVQVKPGPPRTTVKRICTSCPRTLVGKSDLCFKCKPEDEINRWLNGDNDITLTKGKNKDTKDFVKRHLIQTRGDRCEVCGFDEKAPDGRTIIQMDHIDGNCFNNALINLKLLCPTHHAMTPTYGNRNKNSGRTYRRKQSSTN